MPELTFITGTVLVWAASVLLIVLILGLAWGYAWGYAAARRAADRRAPGKHTPARRSLDWDLMPPAEQVRRLRTGEPDPRDPSRTPPRGASAASSPARRLPVPPAPATNALPALPPARPRPPAPASQPQPGVPLCVCMHDVLDHANPGPDGREPCALCDCYTSRERRAAGR
jgi:hypothetical protein